MQAQDESLDSFKAPPDIVCVLRDQGAGFVAAYHGLQVAAGAKCPSGTCNDQHPDGIVSPDVFHGVADLVHGGIVEGVETLRAVQRQLGDVLDLVLIQNYVLVV